MIRPGLTSITFRQLTVAEVIAATVEAELAGVEWGGDIHVPPGDLSGAAETGRQTRAAGLAVSSYGSYHRLGDEGFARILETAVALGAPMIRVWAGNRGSGESSAADRARIAAAAAEAGTLAAAASIQLGLELHSGTLTDAPDSAEALMAEIGQPNVRLYWQPYHPFSPEENLQSLRRLAPHLSNFHVFHWNATATERFLLAEGEVRWRLYLNEAAQLPGDRWALLEFAREDARSAFRADAAVLRRLLAGAGKLSPAQ